MNVTKRWLFYQLGSPTLFQNRVPLAGEWAHGHEVIPHMGPAPPAGTHRYCFVLFRNPKDMPLEVRLKDCTPLLLGTRQL